MSNFIKNFFCRARTLDPVTSHQAADQIKTVAPKHIGVIHDCLHEHGPLGKDGIARYTKLSATQIARRLPEMENMKIIEETGFTVPSDAGRQEREWKAL
jgi:hypothetical protein